MNYSDNLFNSTAAPVSCYVWGMDYALLLLTIIAFNSSLLLFLKLYTMWRHYKV
jgi:hypothetical protein